MLTSLWRKWRASRHGGPQLDVILASADPDAPLAERNLWMVDLSRWLDRPGRPATPATSTAPGTPAPDADAVRHPQHARLRYLLQVLENNPERAAPVAATLRSLVADNDPTSLLCDTGVASHPGFWGEFWDRAQARILPPPPNRSDMFGLFSLIFRRAGDAQWIESLDDDTLARMRALYRQGDGLARLDPTAPEPPAPRLEAALTSSIQVLVSQVRATGLAQDIRSRLPGRVEDSPFFALAGAAAELCDSGPDTPREVFGRRLNMFRALLDGCRAATQGVYDELEKNGVSVEVVFQIERMKLRLDRIELLLSVWVDPTQRHKYVHLTAELIRSTQARSSIRHLAASSFAQLARRVMERTAETGEHYIARDAAEYLTMLKASLGGGFIMVFTVYLKFFIVSLHLDKFIEGLLASLNYAGGFLVIHFAHFTLATKQPAMTGPALAHRLDDAYTPQGREAFLDDTLAMIRSNAAAILGNLAVVFPLAWAVQWIALNGLDRPLISADKAQETLASFSAWGPTPIYAAATGVLLWLSSLIAGWADNWFALHRVHDVMVYNRRARHLLGERGAARWAGFWQRNISGIAGNVSLGLMLGLGPAIVSFFGPHVEVRHVTLSAGQIGTALGTLGWEVVHTQAFWMAVAGTAITGLLNVGVSFALAFNVALRSRNLRRGDRDSLSAGVRQRIWQRPATLFWPVKPRPAPERP
ncbi:site-specific recombinase [Achromobacter marplatensis]|uniref:Site-specific recombinase n=1 Tax=Achromobacter marplatensis TaxID=470868 RepID=A0AA43B1E9_9BURK|nr:site-specific recombinase [Achromobacter marplatensis]EJO28934.1 membrane protein [Achromobacter marplatensis]MDH2051815.1 site-specific recombinase [Achromobacter marplatensis]